MPTITIDNRQIEFSPGETVLIAARRAGFAIPTMCFHPDLPAETSCMVCLVRDGATGKLLPSCALPAEDGATYECDSETVHAARRAAIELLLAEHVGDCEGPCTLTCPAGMDIPRMIRQIQQGDLAGAIATVKADIALPAVLGRICAAPCEKACRRRDLDEAVSIMLLKRHVADADLASTRPFRPELPEPSGKRVAVVGAGPAGLATAWHLRQLGHAVTIFEAADFTGGALRTCVEPERLDPATLDAEIATILALDVEVVTGVRIGRDRTVADLRAAFDAICLCVGHVDEDGAEELGVAPGPKGIAADLATLTTERDGVFAAGDCIRRRRWTVLAVADGKAAAASIDQYLRWQDVTRQPGRFQCRIGKLDDGEANALAPEASDASRQQPAGEYDPLAETTVTTEAGRCLHCDCRKPDNCVLRQHAETYHAQRPRPAARRRRLAVDRSHPQVLYEPGKCIRCGTCVRLTAYYREPYGLTFVGRGFGARVAVPMDHPLCDGLTHSVADIVAACPTGALAWKDT